MFGVGAVMVMTGFGSGAKSDGVPAWALCARALCTSSAASAKRPRPNSKDRRNAGWLFCITFSTQSFLAAIWRSAKAQKDRAPPKRIRPRRKTLPH